MENLKTGDKVRVYHGITGERLTDWVPVKVLDKKKDTADVKEEDKNAK